MLLAEINRLNARIVAFVGLAKNAGKTTAMNAVVADLTAADTRVGVLLSLIHI